MARILRLMTVKCHELSLGIMERSSSGTLEDHEMKNVEGNREDSV